MIDSNVAVAALVSDHPECAEVLQRHRIDFCCRGEQPLVEAARARGLELTSVVADLEGAISRRSAAPISDPRSLSTASLVDHIVTRHHGFLRQTLPFVRQLAQKVARVHGEHNPRLHALEAAVGELDEALIPHLDDEERTLFPGLLRAEGSPRLSAQLEQMFVEHLEAAAILERIRDACEDFTLPEWACNSYRTLFRELEALETDTFTHVHLENHVLRPRFVDAPRSSALS